MSKFCSYCDNLLDPAFYNDELVFKCGKCHIRYQPEEKDTLRYERIKESNIMIYEKIINKAVDDPATIKVYKNCINKNCNGNIVKQIPIGNEMRLYNICTKCRSQWLN